jgi:hypothetical protein
MQKKQEDVYLAARNFLNDEQSVQDALHIAARVAGEDHSSRAARNRAAKIAMSETYPVVASIYTLTRPGLNVAGQNDIVGLARSFVNRVGKVLNDKDAQIKMAEHFRTNARQATQALLEYGMSTSVEAKEILGEKKSRGQMVREWLSDNDVLHPRELVHFTGYSLSAFKVAISNLKKEGWDIECINGDYHVKKRAASKEELAEARRLYESLLNEARKLADKYGI